MRDLLFSLIKLVENLLAPSLLMLEMSVAGALLLAFRRPWGFPLLWIGLGGEILLALLPVGAWLAAPLEDRFPHCRAVPDDLAGIVVLGGAVEPAIAAARGTTALNGAAERMTEFVAEALRHPHTRLAFTGGSGSAFGRGALSEADVARRLFDALGLGGRDIVYEDRSRTTWENARDLAPLERDARDHAPPEGDTRDHAPPEGDAGGLGTATRPWLLITSALHMPRAVLAFRAAGWQVLADPVAYESAPGWRAAFSAAYPEKLGRLDGAFHEWLGLVVYRVLGRTDRLLPEPGEESCR